jgi:predicted nucleic acid-binding protein
VSVVFADTSFFVALLNRRDIAHSRAVEISLQHRGRLITSEYVLLEVANWFAPSNRRSAFGSLLRQLHDQWDIEIVESSHVLFERGVVLYTARRDKEWSLTDCISMVILEDRQLKRVLTSDHHFEQAGYEVLLK